MRKREKQEISQDSSVKAELKVKTFQAMVEKDAWARRGPIFKGGVTSAGEDDARQLHRLLEMENYTYF